MSVERTRVESFGKLEDGLLQASDWYLWGPYLSERQWGTVREDYSADGEAWDYFPHDHARSRAYRWGEDGLAGFSDVEQCLCLSLALWNGRDPILKERIFGLTGSQGNHGEDAKEYWFYVDAVPSHASNRWRYHYPQRSFPYGDLVAENGRRGKHDPEYELLDTGAFDDDRYWIVEVDYTKASTTDLLMTIRVTNAGAEPDTIHVLPTAWFRNTLVVGRRRHQATVAGRCRRNCRGRSPAVRRPRTAGRRRAERRFTDRALLRERDERRPPVRRLGRHAVPEGRHQRPRRRRIGHRQPGTWSAPKPRAGTRRSSSPAQRRSSG